MYNVQYPRTDDTAIEQEIQSKGLTAPRVTPARIQDQISSEHYFTATQGAEHSSAANSEHVSDVPSLGMLTFCVLVLRNGFTVTGESACASPENFDAEIGRKIARENAVQKIWVLEGYVLKNDLYAQNQANVKQFAFGAGDPAELAAIQRKFDEVVDRRDMPSGA